MKQKKIKYFKSVFSSYFIKSVKSDVEVKLPISNSVLATLMTNSSMWFSLYKDNET